MADLNTDSTAPEGADVVVTSGAPSDELEARLVCIEESLAWLTQAQQKDAERTDKLAKSVNHLGKWVAGVLGRLGVETPVDYGGDLGILR